ncbi:MAG: hypothetical protein E4H27_08125, partial [Anaerolineales bacterium]
MARKWQMHSIVSLGLIFFGFTGCFSPDFPVTRAPSDTLETQVSTAPTIIHNAAPTAISTTPNLRDTPTERQENATNTGTYARGIILYIGDGMGEMHRTAARWAGYGVDGTLAMDSLLYKGLSHTAPSGGTGVTDSAAAGTALATGIKTVNGYVGMSPQGENLATILEIAKQQGYAVGLVTTTQLGHATPASFAAHVLNRNQYTTIVKQMLDLGVDVLLAGGEDDLLPADTTGCYPGKGHRTDGLNLVEQAQSNGYVAMCGPDEFYNQAAIPGMRYLGLFGDDGMLRPHTPSLADMTNFAINVLSADPEGFFLMVEGGQIDWAAHDNDAENVILDTLAFDAAVANGLAYAETSQDVLIIVTADHETGGMAVSMEDSGKVGQDGPFHMVDKTPFFVTWGTGSH